MPLPAHKTRIVCTIGPASESPEAMARMLDAGMNVARLNFSHGTFEYHRRVIDTLRDASRRTGRRLAIMADLPGPKMRIGSLAGEPVHLEPGESFTLTTDDIVGDATRASVSLPRLPASVRAGNTLYLNDGIIRLEVEQVRGNDVACRVTAGGELRSRKGLNVPGVDLGIGAFTERDRECLKFALERGVDAVSQSFVASAEDLRAVRQAARSLGRNPFLIAKIERSVALDRIDEILGAADGIMVARGDLGVEIPIERIAIEPKRVHRAKTRPAAAPRLAHGRLPQRGDVPGTPVFLRRPLRETGRGAEGLAILGETMDGGKGRPRGLPDPGGRAFPGPSGRGAAAGSHRPAQYDGMTRAGSGFPPHVPGFSTWPPNRKRIADRSLSWKSEFPREANRP